jgi:LPS O-antigen subunit length determinant protein (WzzB/FepE family)
MNKNYIDEVDLQALFLILWNRKFLITALTILSACISVFVAINKPNIYKSSALVIVNDNTGGGGMVSSLASQYGGLASLAGIQLPSSGSADKTSLAIETIKSRYFFKYLISKNKILPELMATKNYNPDTKLHTLDDEVFNILTDTWLKDDKGKDLKPSFLESYSYYRDILSIKKDDETGYLNISIVHLSPIFAEKFLSLILQEVNVITRDQDLDESNKALEYLTSMAPKTTIAGVKNSINKLIEAQLETQMLANVNEDYLLQSIDPPYVPELKFLPSRAKIAIFGTVSGCFLSIFIVLFYSKLFLSDKFIRSNRNN